jgi:hypothetical protein
MLNKAEKTIIPDFFKSFCYFDNLFSELKNHNFLVYGGEDFQQRTAATVVGWNCVNKILVDV